MLSRSLLHNQSGAIKLRTLAVTVSVAAIVLAGSGFYVRAQQDAELTSRTQRLAIPTVTVTQPERRANGETIDLPGRLEAYKTAAIYSRVDGYVQRWLVDIGDSVTSGQVLAELDTPDVDQQLARARAELSVAQANADLARSTAERWRQLRKIDAVSEQEAEQRIGSYRANMATVRSAQASVDLLEVTKAYGQIKAPFSGVVTRRETDIGDLVNAGSNNGEALFEIAEVGTIRAYVRVPQNYLKQVRVGTVATLTVPEAPQAEYRSRVSAFSGSVEADSGTALMQILVDNAERQLAPGSYATVKLQLEQPDNVFTLPASTLIFDGTGLSVAAVTKDNTVRKQPITIARDLGAVIEVETGLQGDEQVVVSPPDGILDGAEVKVVSGRG